MKPPAPAPHLSLVNEKKILRRLKKKAITKTAKGSIAKVRRRYPGTASLRDTSSEGSVSSRGSSSGSREGRSDKILAGSGLEKRKSSEGATLADDKISLAGGRLEKGKPNDGAILANDESNLAGGRLEKGKSNEGAILADDKISLAGGRLKTGGYEEEAEPPAEVVQCRHDDVSSLGSDVRPTFSNTCSLSSRWKSILRAASTFHGLIKGDDEDHLLEGLHRSFPTLRRVQDLEQYSSYKSIMKSASGSQKLVILLCIIYLSYATPTTMTLADRSSTVYVFNYTHTPLEDNFTRVCAEKQIAPKRMVANLLKRRKKEF